jgi:MFS family permease
MHMIDELRWVIGLNVVLALWLGMLADSWKGRRMGVWMVIGFLTSIFGLALLIYLPSCRRDGQEKDVRRPFSREDSYGH